MQNMRTITEETRDPKYSHIERERRWLVDPKLRPALDVLPYTRIEDRYISGTRLRLRRMTSSASSEQSLKLTKKYKCPDPLARPMVTAYLTQEEYKLFSNLECL